MENGDGCGSPTIGLKQLRITGSVTAFLAIISLGINCGVNAYLTNFKPGAWWASLLALITASLAICSTLRGIVIATCIFSIFAVILGLIGCFVDGINTSFVKTIQACSSGPYPATQIPALYGNSAFYSAATQCYIWATDYHNCFCVNTNNSPSIDDTSPNVCYIFDGQSDCNHILVNYPQMLGAATAFDVFTLLCVFTLSIMTCCSLCCPKNLGYVPPPTADAVPSGPTVVIATPGQTVVGAAGQAYPMQAYPVQGYPPAIHLQQGYPPAGGVQYAPQLVYASAIPQGGSAEKAAASGSGVVGTSSI